MRLLLLNGPNLNLLGTREPEVYGTTTLAEVAELAAERAAAAGWALEAFQSNHEGALIDRIHAARGSIDGIVFNPGALTHTSYALHDAIAGVDIPTVEIHVSNVEEREPWRSVSVVGPATVHRIYGRGVDGYRDAVDHLIARLTVPPTIVAYGETPDQVGDLRVPDGTGPFPAMVIYHGGFWRRHWTRDLMDRLAIDLHVRGFATWNVEYRRIPPVGGWRDTTSDAVAALDHMATLALEQPIDLGAIQTLGHSAGGHLALWAAWGATQVQASRAISLAGVLDLRESLDDDPMNGPRRFLGDDVDTHLEAACIRHQAPLGVPQLIVHGAADASVPASSSVRYAETAANAGDPVETMWLPDVDHMAVIDPDSTAWERIAARL